MKSEILNLHTLTEAEQVEWLKQNRILQMVKCTVAAQQWQSVKGDRWESLADCAFRLRPSLMSEDIEEYYLLRFYKGKAPKGLNVKLAAHVWFAQSAEPIEWIECYLVKKERKDL
jgi:hypothetical protein